MFGSHARFVEARMGAGLTCVRSAPAGYHLLCSHALTLLMVPIAATGLVSARSRGPGPPRAVACHCMPGHMPPLSGQPARFFGLQLELANMYQSGEITTMWQVAKQTDLQFNMVSPGAGCWCLSACACTGHASWYWEVPLSLLSHGI